MDDDVAAVKQQVLVTKSDFSADKYRLVELNANVEEAFKAGGKVFIVGAPTERAVLCTSTQSFYLTKEDTSNLRLLTEHAEWKPRDADDSEASAGRDEIVVRGSAKFHFLLQPKGQDIMRLKALLMESPYEQAGSSKSSPTPQKRAKLHTLYTTEDLVSTLQTSEKEILEMLNQLHAFEDARTWRLLSASYQSRVVGDMLDAIVQNEHDFVSAPGIPLAKFQEEIEHPLVVIRQCCKIYGTLHTGESGEETCTLEPSKIAGFCAKQLFEEQSAQFQETGGSGGDGWELDQFMDKWALRVPDKVTVSVEMLRGVGLMKAQKGKPTRVVYFPEEDLPLEAKQRFEKLFQVQEKWTIQQLEPFIQSLVVPGTTQAALLLKHTRSSRQINSTERLYSRR
ncbi:Sister chromatid cohesion protein dcc1 [Globisporangium polare]